MEPSAAAQAAVNTVSAALQTSGITMSDYIFILLEHPKLQEHPCTVNLVNNTAEIIMALSNHPYSKDSAFNWAATTMRKKYSETIKSLIACEEWHFNASHACAKQLEDFWIEDMAMKMKELAPDLWLMLDVLLMGNSQVPLTQNPCPARVSRNRLQVLIASLCW